MPKRLSEMDRLGVHRNLVLVDLLRRFEKVRREARKREEMELLVKTSTLLVLKTAGRDLRDLGKEEFRRILEDLDTWERTRLRPAAERLQAAAKAGLRLAQVKESLNEYEPAWTDWALLYEKGWTDFEGNRRAVVEAVRLGERRGVLAKHGNDLEADLADMQMEDSDVAGFLELVTSQDPGQRLFYVTSEGQFRLGATEGRDALESVLGIVEPVRQRDGTPLQQDFEQDDQAREDPAKIASEIDLLASVREWLRGRRDRAEAGSVDAIAADNFERLMEGLSVRELARETRAARPTLDRAARSLRANLASRFFPEVRRTE